VRKLLKTAAKKMKEIHRSDVIHFGTRVAQGVIQKVGTIGKNRRERTTSYEAPLFSLG
jgi:hypothetical protein